MKDRSSPCKDGSALGARVLDALLAKLNNKGRGKGKDKGDKGVLKTIGKRQVSPDGRQALVLRVQQGKGV